MTITPSFTYAHYEETLNRYISAGYFIGGFSEFLAEKPTGKYMILRHDIDSSLELQRLTTSVE
jgi:hypothetical protein